MGKKTTLRPMGLKDLNKILSVALVVGEGAAACFRTGGVGEWLIKTAQRQNISEDNKLMEDQIILGRLNRCFRQKYVARMKSEKRAEK